MEEEIVPRQRMLEVAEHYYHFDGRSPINDQNRALVAALERRLDVPVYWGNRNWHPLLKDAIEQMRADRIWRALAFVTSAFGSYSGCRQYIEDIERARAAVEDAPPIDKIRPFSTNPKFLEAMIDRTQAAFQDLPHGRLVFTAHSIPVSMAQSSPYAREPPARPRSPRLLDTQPAGNFAWQSHSGAADATWLRAPISAIIASLAPDTVVVPISGFSPTTWS